MEAAGWKHMDTITNNDGGKSCRFSAESSRIVFQSWSLSVKHTGLLDHTETARDVIKI